MLHWLILIPYYFFAALSTALLLLLLCRVLRVRLGASLLVTASVVLALLGVAAPLIGGLLTIRDYSTMGFVVLALGSLLLAFVDTLLRPLLPLPADLELEEL